MKIVILGASGLVGWNFHQAALSAGHEVVGTYSRCSLPGLVQLTLRDERDVAGFLSEHRPDAVACCAAWSWVDGCQGDRTRAFRENRDAPRAAARAAQAAGARFLHFSSSYVFNGKDGPYTEEDAPDPINVYGESKLAGEQAVLEATGGAGTVVRTMGVYGREPQAKNFVYQVRRALGAGERFRVPSDQFGNATEAQNLADGCLSLLADGRSGVWHIAGPDPGLNRVDFARRIARDHGLDEALIDPVATAELSQPAPRPRQAGLLCTKMSGQTSWLPAPWEPFEK